MRQWLVINCDAHVDTTNHTPNHHSSQSRPTERPAGIQGDERCLRLCPLPSFQRLLRHRAASLEQNDIIMPKASEQSRALSLLRDMPCCACVCSTARYHHTSKPNYITFLCRSRVVSESTNTCTSSHSNSRDKKANCYYYPHLLSRRTPTSWTIFKLRTGPSTASRIVRILKPDREPTSKTKRLPPLALLPLPTPVLSTVSTLRPVRLLRALTQEPSPIPS